MANQPLLKYKSLDDIRIRKETLRQQLQSDSLSMKTQWNTLFHKPYDSINDNRRIGIRRTSIGMETLQPFRRRKTKSSEKEKRTARQSVFLKSRLFRIEN